MHIAQRRAIYLIYQVCYTIYEVLTRKITLIRLKSACENFAVSENAYAHNFHYTPYLPTIKTYKNLVTFCGQKGYGNFMVHLSEITSKLEKLYPLSYACSWDNVGLIVGNREKTISKVLVALDFDIEVAKEAKEIGAELILTHHPIIFSPINKINSDTPLGRALLFLIENKIALYSAHTNLDCAPGGINDYLVELYGFKNMHHTDIEPGKEFGLGRVSELANPMTLKELADHIGKKLNLDHIYYIGRDDAVIRTAFTCSGSGGSLISADKGADVFITGDIKYSGAREFNEQGLNVICAGHYDTEIHTTTLFKKALSGFDIKIVKSKANTNIVKTQEL